MIEYCGKFPSDKISQRGNAKFTSHEYISTTAETRKIITNELKAQKPN